MTKSIKLFLLSICVFIHIRESKSQIFSLKSTDIDLLTEDLQTLYHFAERARHNIEPYTSFETKNLLDTDFSKTDRSTIVYEVVSKDKSIYDFVPDVMKRKLKLDFVRDEVDKKEHSITMIYRDCTDGLRITVTGFSNTKRIFVSVQWFDKKIRHRIMELYDCQG